MYVPVEAGLVLIRDAKPMRDTFSLVPPYLRSDDDRHGVHGPPWLSEYGSEQTRPFRALKVWMALHMAPGLRRRSRTILRWRATSPIACAPRPSSSSGTRKDSVSSAFARLPLTPGERRRDGTAQSACAGRRCSSEAERSSSSTVLDGRSWLRACIVNPGTMPEDIDETVDAVLDVVREELRRSP